MTEKTYEQEILDHVRKLNKAQQQRVLAFVKALERPEGEPGWLAVQHAEEINFPAEDLAEIKAALQDLEEIDLNEWDLPS